MSELTWTERKAATEEAFKNPMVGDVFQEMLSVWVKVIFVDESSVLVEETTGSGTTRQLWTRKEYSTSAYRYSGVSLKSHWLTIDRRAGDRPSSIGGAA